MKPHARHEIDRFYAVDKAIYEFNTNGLIFPISYFVFLVPAF